MNHRKVFSAIVTTVLMLLLLHINIAAVPIDFEQEDGLPIMQYVVNPLYRGSVYASAPQSYPGTESVNAFATRPSFDNINDAAAYVRSQMKVRSASIEFVYNGAEKMKEIINEAVRHTGVPGEGDSLAHCWTSYNFTYGTSKDRYYGLYVNYITTYEQESELSEKVAATLASLNLDGKSEFEKIEAIYSWICSHVEYDHVSEIEIEANLPLTNPYQDAYGAMCLGTSVCRGYALLCYRMMLEAGIDCRYISGYLNHIPHAWNIIKCDGTYYFADSTNDSVDLIYKMDNIKTRPNGTFQLSCATYNYFLKGKTVTSDIVYLPDEYIWDDEYCSPEFLAEYPVSDVDYTGHHIHDYTLDIGSGYVQEPTCTEPGFGNAKCSCGQFIERGVIFAPYGHYYGSDGICTVCGMKYPSLLPESGELDISSLIGRNYDEIFATFKDAFPGKDVRSASVMPPEYDILVTINKDINYEEGFSVTASIEDSACTSLNIGAFTVKSSSDIPSWRPEVSLMNCLKEYPNVTLCYNIPVAITMEDLENELKSKGIEYTKTEQPTDNLFDSGTVFIAPASESMPNGDLNCCWMYDSASHELVGAFADLRTFTPGDVNGDGNVTLEDAVQTLKRAMNVDVGNEAFIEEAADVVADGKISLEDAIEILKMAMNVSTVHAQS